MRACRFQRWSAVLALLSVVVLLVTSTGILAADDEAGTERCVGCSGCASGECDDAPPRTAHHHCCTTCCMSHTSLALPCAPSTQAPALAEPVLTPTVAPVTARSKETPYRPPRA